MEKIFFTGCAGFIGQKTVQILLEKGHEVFGVDNLNDYYDVRVKKWRLEQLNKYPGFRFEKMDIENKSKLKSVFKKNKFDAVINLAARAGVRYSMENPYVYMSTNADATLNLLEIMRENSIKKMVMASTSSLYAGQKMPFNEELPVNTPISPYAASKKAAEVLSYTYSFLYNMDISIVRYFTVYGPASRPDMGIWRFVKWIEDGTPIELFGDGTQSRDFTYVDDIAEGTIKALKPVGYEIINLGGGQNPISINYVISKIEEYLGKKAVINHKEFHKADVKDTWADITKADKILDWKPKIEFDEGLKRTVEWHVKNRQWLKDIKLPD